jgi:hypothetical protein
MTSEVEARLSEAIELSEAICGVAEVGDWDQVQRLLADRHAMLEESFQHPVGQDATEAVASAIQGLFAVDQKIFALLEAARSEARDSLRTLELERKAKSAYGRI